jgi:hypothetical protein
MKPESISKYIGRDVLITWMDPQDDWPSFRVLGVDGEELWLRGITHPRGIEHDGGSFLAKCSEVKRIRPFQTPGVAHDA